jgi:hypothetical protein
MDMPRPGDAHHKLQALVGAWIGDERIQPSPWDPVGGPAEGSVENRLILDGFAVGHDYTQRRNGQVNFQGHGVFRYDAAADEYQLHWFDSMGQAPNVFRGGFDGPVLRLQTSYGGGHTRASWDMSEADRVRYAMEISGDGQTWQVFIEGDYRRT